VKEKLTGPEGMDWLTAVFCVLAHRAVAREKAAAKSKTDACLTNGTFMVFISRKFRCAKQLLPSAEEWYHQSAASIHRTEY
jgi:hypothetical protein